MSNTDIVKGLTSAEAEQRVLNGLCNGNLDVKTKSVKRILFDNIFTFFNLINVVLAVLVLITGSIKNALFMGIILCNTAIGIFQEIRSKRVLDKLLIISAPKARLIRDGEEKTMAVSEIVTDDIMVLSTGNQVCADAVVVEGECEANESLITGESDAIAKKEGDELISGSFIVSGSVKAMATRVGAKSTSGKITSSAKLIKKRSSEMMSAIDKIIRIVAVCVIPFGVILFLKDFLTLHLSFEEGVTSTVAALISMIPEGLVLLTSVALAISSVRLARKQTLCQDLFCVEALARVDVLCLDKTGTITEGTQEISEIIPLNKEFDYSKALSAFAAAFQDPNPTLKAIGEKFTEKTDYKLLRTIAFSSSRKWSAAEFKGIGSIAVGAPSFVLGDKYAEIEEKCESLSTKGFRTLVVAHSSNSLEENALPADISPKAVIAMSDKIRASAPKVFEYFKKQGVALKVISGDDPKTVSNIAIRAGFDNAENYVDMSKVTDEELPKLVEKCSVFGRVSPYQKLEIIKALKANGHKAAMTGDGVNDVPALKEADCSVTVQSGSDAARSVSQIVLMNNDFASMPLVVEEGRRCINNIQRSSSLFLVKAISAFLVAIAFLFLPYAYPLKPIQMSLVNALTIGAPSFVLALEPNHNIVRGSFLANVLRKSVPNAVATALGLVLLVVLRGILGFEGDDMSTIATFLIGAAYFGSLFATCIPFNKLRAVMFVLLAAVFCVVPFISENLRELFCFKRAAVNDYILTGCMIAFVWTAQFGLTVLVKNMKISGPENNTT